MSNIAVIGTGNMGKGIALALAAANHQVWLGSRSLDKAQEVVNELGLTQITAATNQAAAAEADFIFLAVPYQGLDDVANEIRTQAAGKVVVDITNPLNETYDGLLTSPDQSSAELVAELFPDSRVVGAFKNTFAGVFYEPVFEGDQTTTVLVIGNDEQAKSKVIQLINSLAFDALDAGSLQSARTIEQMTVMLIGLSMKYNYNWRAGFKLLA